MGDTLMDDYTFEKEEVSDDEQNAGYGFDSCQHIDVWIFPRGKWIPFDVPKYEIICDVKNVW